MKKIKLVFLVLAVFTQWAVAVEPVAKYEPKRNLTVVFYNVENLFDIINNQGARDGEFTPAGENKWTTERYLKKLNDIAKVLSSVNKNELPEIIGLCEIENRTVLNDLLKTESLKKGKYEVAHFESPDYRGIDCALLYRPDEFRLISKRPVRVSFPDDPEYSTRDILYVKGKTLNNEEFHIFVNHWPSRIGGLEETEKKRVAVAGILKSKTDSVLQQNPEANILIMGDMNDEPSNKSLSAVLGAKNPETGIAPLVNVMFPQHVEKNGSYNYRGNWNMLDNIIVSDDMLDGKGFRCIDRKGYVFHEPWMEYKAENGTVSPNRTYGGPNYYGGVSDHFPVYVKFSR
jgi:predicted extracellular nuclease